MLKVNIFNLPHGFQIIQNLVESSMGYMNFLKYKKNSKF